MRVLSQSEIDNMLASLLADPGVLPGGESTQSAASETAASDSGAGNN